MQRYTVYFIWKLLYMFRVVPPPIIRSANNCIYSIWYLSHRYYYLALSWRSWNWFECAVALRLFSQMTKVIKIILVILVTEHVNKQLLLRGPHHQFSRKAITSII